ncbi:MAG: DNA alkylation repair protein [Clostridia bacterium]
MNTVFKYEDYQMLLAELERHSDDAYRRFNQSLMPGTECVYGVRIPELRRMARKIIDTDWRGYLAVARDDTHTERMLQGIVIGMAKCEYDELCRYIKWFVPKINNWAICDTFCSSVKGVIRQPCITYGMLLSYINSSSEYDVRFAIVMLMNYFFIPEYIDEALALISNVAHDGYYAKMAAAWALSVCFVKFREKTLTLLHNVRLNDFIYNRTISKICESYRVSDVDKEILRQMRGKNLYVS